jgi:cyclomaltodextrinase
MKNILKVYCYIFLLIAHRTQASSIILDNRDAVVWLPQQTVSGKLSGFQTKHLYVHHDQNLFSVNVNRDSTFSIHILLHDAENKIWITTDKSELISDTLILILGYHPLPVVKPYAVIFGNKATLHATIIDNPFKQPLHFFWTENLNNPAQCRLTNQYDSVTSAEIPFTEGVYYFNLLITSGKDSTWLQTFVIRKEKQLHAFDISTEHAAWIDNAVIYEITPSHFVKDATYDDITEKLHELKNFGINTIWLQPVFQNKKGGQGYDITDYFSLRTDLGSEQQLKHLITVAKSLHMHVLFDFVPNHTSIYHPYAQDYLKYGTASHYYNFYQREKDGAKYSSHYKKDSSEFITYFWKDLVNLNYNNPEVQQWIIEACKYWIRKLDIDGYRFDAVWAVNARAPSFGKRLRTELKSIKPDLFLLAEDKASDEQVYEKGFDAAFDWTMDTSWVSQWSWQQDFKSNTTIFNFPDANKRGAMMRQALFYNGSTTRLRLRFIENNDLPRFIKTHNPKQTKMAAALLFSLPGIPLIYNGQEIGFTGHPYSKKPIFEANESIQSLDSNQLFSYYQKLVRLRMQYSSLRDTTLKELPVSPNNTLVAFHRWKNNERFIIIINLDSISKEAAIDLNKIEDVFSRQKSFFKDVLNREEFKAKNNSHLKIPMEGYGIRWLLLTRTK